MLHHKKVEVVLYGAKFMPKEKDLRKEEERKLIHPNMNNPYRSAELVSLTVNNLTFAYPHVLLIIHHI